MPLMKSSIGAARRHYYIFLLGIFLCHGIQGFQLSMVASRTPMSRSPIPSSAKSPMSQRSQPAASDRVTSTLISQLAVGALKLRLHSQTHVDCDVTASPSTVLRGQIGPVTVKGRGWGSRLGLTCRVIEATVDQCELDMGRVVSKRKLVLNVPAEGRAMVALNSDDFGKFITHPLMKPPGIVGDASEDDSRLEFMKENVSLDAKTGIVTFFGTYLGQTWQFTLQRGSDEEKALIKASLHKSSQSDANADWESVARQLTEITSKFFNEMVFELDGTFLSFSDMMLTGKGQEPIIMLSLGILVKKFPSPGLDF
eukprot:CAMPEP_0113635786 /NCGR_PEP_ID=MMETSP0017_2-20120614/18658_1 /TAXON_ID=2856 /ORGANISM="Cylindrotheca closterium" /LENGTH=310 /DNA_ID=CAMNT_0000546589 /DNA_START=61 /DNA_END=993 /DNA_ORIENTATION=+ /assembly_acc=CAM_ASM_000147